jgi:excisionase family DNA binding protein
MQATSLGTAIARVRRDSLPTISERKGRVMAEDQEVLTVEEVCDLLRVHPTTLYKLAKQGNIPSFRIVCEWRFRKDSPAIMVTQVQRVDDMVTHLYL